MGTLFGFVVGYVVGARAGSDGFDDVVNAFNDIRRSREFQSFVAVATHHGRGALTRVLQRLAEPPEARLSTIERARRRAEGLAD